MRPTLLDLVRTALTTDIAGAHGETLRSEVDEATAAPTGAHAVLSVEYAGAEHGPGGTDNVGRYAVTVDERDRVVRLDVTPDTYERRRECVNVAAIQDQFVHHLTALLREHGDASRCRLKAKVVAEHTIWVRCYDWDSAYRPFNGAHLYLAAAKVHEAAHRQRVWDATGLADRIRDLVAPDPRGATGDWRHLVDGRTPSELYDGLDGIREGLGKAVFAAMPCWYGQRMIRA